jgi:TetR/AcrR family tetracycline transcriptional repressor
MTLDRDSIVQTALILLNDVGLDDLTTRRLAAELGVQSPALYWHFRNKRALLDAMAERMLADADLHGAMKPGVAWEKWLAENARRFRRALLAYRDGARVHAGTRPSAALLPDIEAQLSALCTAGFSPADAVHTSIAIGRYTVGCVIEEQADASDASARRVTGGDPFSAHALAGYPTLARAVARTRHDKPSTAFEFGLQLMIAGLAKRIGAGATPAKTREGRKGRARK